MKVYFHTLGCKVNQYETQAMESLLRERGFEIVTDSGGCDMVIVNTCAVTAESGRKSRQAIRRLKTENPDAVIGVCGCFAQIEPDSIAGLADVLGGSGDRRGFIENMDRAYRERQLIVDLDKPLKRREFENLPAGRLEGRTRAMMKIQDGCSNFCSYCVIPYARGPVRSMCLADCDAEAKRLGDSGVNEIMITGIEIASYGRDFRDGTNLIDAILTIAHAAPNTRLRLGSLEPRIITEDFCVRLKNLPNLCPHFHLSLQSGCDDTLRRMGRKYDTARFYESVTLLNEHFPDCGITTDLIVGFPGETEEEFAETLAFIEKCGFSRMHIFPYSVRPGTAAADMPEQVSKEVKHSRARRAAAVAAELERRFLEGRVGTVQPVLFETEHSGVFLGHAPNYCEVEVKGENLRDKVKNVQIISVNGDKLVGNIIL